MSAAECADKGVQRMRCVLNENVALRSWKLVPYAYYVRGYQYAQKLSREQFELLSQCDGRREMDKTPLLGQLERAGFVREAQEGETWSEWSKPRRCDNRYFPSVNWAVTGKCNFNCKHCFMAADNAPMMGEFSWEECVAFLDECESCGIQSVTLTGGEPMLHPRFRDIMREIYRRGMYLTELNTNGSFLTADFLDELKRLDMDTEIKISFDGIGHHDWLRGVPHAEEKALRAMKLAKEKGFRVRSQTNVHRGNLDVMYDTVAMLDGMGVEEIRIIRTTETPRWRKNGGNATLGIVEYYDEMTKLIERCLGSGFNISVDVWQFAHYRPGRGDYYFHPVQSDCGKYRDGIPACRGARGTVAVSYTGEVYPCNQTSGTFANMGINFGNVKTTLLHELLSGGKYLELVTMPVSDIREENEPCRNCQYWRCCMGGCRAIALAFTKDYKHYDPAKCAFFKGGYMQKLDEVFERAGRPYVCLSETGGMARHGEPEDLARTKLLLGSYA